VVRERDRTESRWCDRDRGTLVRAGDVAKDLSGHTCEDDRLDAWDLHRNANDTIIPAQVATNYLWHGKSLNLCLLSSNHAEGDYVTADLDGQCTSARTARARVPTEPRAIRAIDASR
jgi:hypothetical protein